MDPDSTWSMRTAFLFENARISLVGNFVAALLVLCAVWVPGKTNTPMLWFTAICCITLCRSTLVLLYERASYPRHSIWRRGYITGLFISAAAWGIGGGLLTPSLQIEHKAVVFLALAATAAGSVATLASLRKTYFFCVLLIIAPVAVITLTSGGRVETVLGISMLLFAGVLMVIARTFQLSPSNHLSVHFDTLTGLASREVLFEDLDSAIDSARTDQRHHCFCSLDLAQFKLVNHAVGHTRADDVLADVANLLLEHTRPTDTVARTGGDEFAIIFHELSVHDARIKAERIRAAVDEYRFDSRHEQIPLSVNIGITPVNSNTREVRDVLRQADRALYAARENSAVGIHIHDDGAGTGQDTDDEMKWARTITRAQQENRLRLSVQEIVTMNEADITFPPGQIHGTRLGSHEIKTLKSFEILLRIRNPDGSAVAANEFWSAAEKFNLASGLDRWVIESTFRWLATHRDELKQIRFCAINLSGQSIGKSEMRDFIENQFLKQDIPWHTICFEITETAAVRDIDSAKEFIGYFRDRGCRFALDDFGSGLSSFAYLKALPVDFLKIDGQFVRGIVDDAQDWAMVKSINEIGKIMGKKTIAEFVEDGQTFALLQTIGVDFAQGYGLSRPRIISEETSLRSALAA